MIHHGQTCRYPNPIRQGPRHAGLGRHGQLPVPSVPFSRQQRVPIASTRMAIHNCLADDIGQIIPDSSSGASGDGRGTGGLDGVGGLVAYTDCCCMLPRAQRAPGAPSEPPSRSSKPSCPASVWVNGRHGRGSIHRRAPGVFKRGRRALSMSFPKPPVPGAQPLDCPSPVVPSVTMRLAPSAVVAAAPAVSAMRFAMYFDE